MTLAADLAADYTLFDGVEEVTITSAGVDTASVPALQRPLQLGPDALTEVRRTTWHVWSTALTIRPGDVLTDSGGTVWVVENSQQVTFKTRWKLTCQEAR